MGAEIEVVTAALRSEAATWEEQSGALTTIASQAEALRLSYLQAGIFMPIVESYESAVNQVSDRCTEGSQRMADIAAALRRNADAYDRRDEAVAESVDNAY
ncbi:MAG: hypothetical protein JWP95_528 [Actinotalea sp.]|nr:hypothetical protein [Actinotalea sp.]